LHNPPNDTIRTLQSPQNSAGGLDDARRNTDGRINQKRIGPAWLLFYMRLARASPRFSTINTYTRLFPRRPLSPRHPIPGHPRSRKRNYPSTPLLGPFLFPSLHQILKNQILDTLFFFYFLFSSFTKCCYWLPARALQCVASIHTYTYVVCVRCMAFALFRRRVPSTHLIMHSVFYIISIDQFFSVRRFGVFLLLVRSGNCFFPFFAFVRSFVGDLLGVLVIA